jgi:hypothetical protein
LVLPEILLLVAAKAIPLLMLWKSKAGVSPAAEAVVKFKVIVQALGIVLAGIVTFCQRQPFI